MIRKCVVQLNHFLSSIGLTVTLGCVIGVPFLYVSDTIIHRFGSANVIVLAFLFYCIRFVSYSLLWLHIKEMHPFACPYCPSFRF